MALPANRTVDGAALASARLQLARAAEKCNSDLRSAAMVLAVGRVAEVIQMRGIHPRVVGEVDPFGRGCA